MKPPNQPAAQRTYRIRRRVVNRMNQLGMLIDVSHAGDQTFWDVIKTSTKPSSLHTVLFTVLYRTGATLKDEQIKPSRQMVA